MTSSTAEVPTRRPRWPFFALAAALVWVLLVRVPLVMNADSHLDSDLAVDGLTLTEATQGYWRWHYPGTPHMGTLPVALSWIQAIFLGSTPATLVSGGVLAYALVVVATFWLAWKAFGPSVAAWSLVPLAFASTGMIWLSGRITGGHLLTLAWHTAAFALLFDLLVRGGTVRSAALGVWCGLGLYLDQMFLFSLVFVLLGVVIWALTLRLGTLGRQPSVVVVVLAFLVGYLPHWRGQLVEPHDAYREQFQTIFRPAEGKPGSSAIAWDTAAKLGAEHFRILGLEALPRLISGHLLPSGETEPNPATLEGRPAPRKSSGWTPLGMATTALSLALFVASVIALVRSPSSREIGASQAVRWGVLGSAAAVTAAFIINLNIYNSDNYRYLVFLFLPWCLGFGVLMNALTRRGWIGRIAAIVLATAFALCMTLDTQAWYARFGWVDDGGLPVRKALRDQVLDWLVAHPEVDGIFGSYWDVYRLSYLTGGRVRGVPYPVFPDRFPEWSETLPGHRPRILVTRGSGDGNYYRSQAIQQGAKELLRKPQFAIYDWP
jgi:hypothetical protein